MYVCVVFYELYGGNARAGIWYTRYRVVDGFGLKKVLLFPGSVFGVLRVGGFIVSSSSLRFPSHFHGRHWVS